MHYNKNVHSNQGDTYAKLNYSFKIPEGGGASLGQECRLITLWDYPEISHSL